jgi:hypothetical protein
LPCLATNGFRRIFTVALVVAAKISAASQYRVRDARTVRTGSSLATVQKYEEPSWTIDGSELFTGSVLETSNEALKNSFSVEPGAATAEHHT